MNKLLKILCSLPIILIASYFVPFLGICLILFRYYEYKNKKYYILPITLIILGIIILLPKIINYVVSILKISVKSFSYISNIIETGYYIKLLSYSKLLITVGIIFLILSFVFKNIFNKVSSKVNNYIKEDLQKDYEIREKNDLIMQEKREKAKNTHSVTCPKCGASNLLSSQTGRCKYCRNIIEYKGGK